MSQAWTSARLQRRVHGCGKKHAQVDERAVSCRKNLIWVSGKFVVGQRAIQKLNGAGVSIYPVDVAGVSTPVVPCGRIEGARPTQR
jgi:hypothetical protein